MTEPLDFCPRCGAYWGCEHRLPGGGLEELPSYEEWRGGEQPETLEDAIFREQVLNDPGFQKVIMDAALDLLEPYETTHDTLRAKIARLEEANPPKHVITKQETVWIPDQGEYGTVITHDEGCPACLLGLPPSVPEPPSAPPS